MAPNSGTNNLSSITISHSIDDMFKKEILTPDCLEFLKRLHENFEPRRQRLLAERIQRQNTFDSGETLEFLENTKAIRDGDWKIAPLPAVLQRRWVEATGPVDKEAVLQALNSGADSYMADFEDFTVPTWLNLLEGQMNMKDAVRRRSYFKDLNPKIATLFFRPRGWHLEEKHVLIHGQRMSGSLFDFGIYFFHNAHALLENGLGPYFYLPKLENHFEARLWNDVFVFSQNELGIPIGTVKATALIETITAALEMDEILFELREHSAGLNAGRWDYIFSSIKVFRKKKDLCFPDRGLIKMTVPFMRAYCLLLIKTCHRRGAPAIGGMSGPIPNENDPVAHAKAAASVREDKSRDARDGFDGGCIAHPGVAEVARIEFEKVLGNKANQIDKQLLDVNISSEDLLNFQPTPPAITEQGLRFNVSVGVEYLATYLTGSACVRINNSIEDVATVEISRSQLWQWIHSPNGVLDDGRKVTAELVQAIVHEEVTRLRETGCELPFEQAALAFTKVAVDTHFEEFLTILLYELL